MTAVDRYIFLFEGTGIGLGLEIVLDSVVLVYAC